MGASAPQAKRIVHFSSVHAIDDVRVFLKECRSLAAAGYDVTLVARGDTSDEVDGVKRIGVPRGKGNRLKRMVFDTLKVARLAWNQNADLYHFHDPELFPVAFVFRIAGKPVIFDAHESISKQIFSKEWIPDRVRPVIARAYRVVEQLGSLFLSGIVAATPAIAELFPASKTVVVQNFPLLSEFQSGDQSAEREREPLVVYVGGITEARGAREMVAAMDRLPNDHAARLVMAGPVASSALRTELMTMPGSERLELAGIQDRDGVTDLLSRASVGLVVLHPEPNYVDSYPVKMFEYMAAGVPVVASNFPFWEQFVQDVGTGVLVDPYDTESIAEGIVDIIGNLDRAREMGAAGISAVQQRFNWDVEAEKLLALVSRVLASSALDGHRQAPHR
jgi:glycosyltransferase involved in cell wall biosynthesis